MAPPKANKGTFHNARTAAGQPAADSHVENCPCTHCSRLRVAQLYIELSQICYKLGIELLNPEFWNPNLELPAHLQAIRLQEGVEKIKEMILNKRDAVSDRVRDFVRAGYSFDEAVRMEGEEKHAATLAEVKKNKTDREASLADDPAQRAAAWVRYANTAAEAANANPIVHASRGPSEAAGYSATEASPTIKKGKSKRSRTRKRASSGKKANKPQQGVMNKEIAATDSSEKEVPHASSPRYRTTGVAARGKGKEYDVQEQDQPKAKKAQQAAQDTGAGLPKKDIEGKASDIAPKRWYGSAYLDKASEDSQKWLDQVAREEGPKANAAATETINAITTAKRTRAASERVRVSFAVSEDDTLNKVSNEGRRASTGAAGVNATYEGPSKQPEDGGAQHARGKSDEQKSASAAVVKGVDTSTATLAAQETDIQPATKATLVATDKKVALFATATQQSSTLPIEEETAKESAGLMHKTSLIRPKGPAVPIPPELFFVSYPGNKATHDTSNGIRAGIYDVRPNTAEEACESIEDLFGVPGSGSHYIALFDNLEVAKGWASKNVSKPTGAYTVTVNTKVLTGSVHNVSMFKNRFADVKLNDMTMEEVESAWVCRQQILPQAATVGSFFGLQASNNTL